MNETKSDNTVITADPQEIPFFNNKSVTWWTIMKPLHAYNRLRISLIRDGLIETGFVKKVLNNSSKPLEGLRILDVGCGGGILAEDLASLGCTVVGIDLGPDLIQIAKEHATLKPFLTNLTYVCESVEDHSVHNYEKYDAVVASEVIEHVNEPDLFLEYCVKCLKPGGSIYVTTFNKTWSSWLFGIIIGEYIWGFLPRGTHSWYKFFDPKDIEKMFENLNCKTRLTRGVIYNFLTRKWHWWNNLSIYFVMQAVKNYK